MERSCFSGSVLFRVLVGLKQSYGERWVKGLGFWCNLNLGTTRKCQDNLIRLSNRRQQRGGAWEENKFANQFVLELRVWKLCVLNLALRVDGLGIGGFGS